MNLLYFQTKRQLMRRYPTGVTGGTFKINQKRRTRACDCPSRLMRPIISLSLVNISDRLITRVLTAFCVGA